LGSVLLQDARRRLSMAFMRQPVVSDRGALVVQQEGACQCQNGQGAQLRRLEQAVAVAFDQAGIQIRIGIRRFPSAA